MILPPRRRTSGPISVCLQHPIENRAVGALFLFYVLCKWHWQGYGYASHAYPVFKRMIHEPVDRPTYYRRKWSYQHTPCILWYKVDPRLVWTIADEKSKRRNWHLCAARSWQQRPHSLQHPACLSPRCICWFLHNLGELESANTFNILVLSILFDPGAE